jgi:hypothetical protein
MLQPLPDGSQKLRRIFSAATCSVDMVQQSTLIHQRLDRILAIFLQPYG